MRREMTVRPGRNRRIDRTEGFTLIELMVVIAIVGVLSSVALPSLRKYVYKAKRTEALVNLKGIHTSQTAYRFEHGEYGASFQDIGFEISGGTAIDANTIQADYYTFTVEAFDVDGATNANYSAVATGDLDPGDAILDIVMIEGGLVLED